MLGSCARNTQGSFCSIYEVVYYAPDTAEETQDQINENNEYYDLNCRSLLNRLVNSL